VNGDVCFPYQQLQARKLALLASILAAGERASVSL
jgi:hypothetical protein